MKYLIDTHLLLWAPISDSRLSTAALEILGDPAHQIFFSSASIWEIAIKTGLGKESFSVDPFEIRDGLLKNGYEELPVRSEHALALTGLPGIHKDPFDRMLIAQAMVEGVTLLTADSAIARYPGPIQRV